MSWRHVALRTVLAVLSRVRVRGTHIAHWDVWLLSMPRVCSVAPFFTFTARLLLTSKTLSLTGHSVDTFSVAPRSAHTFDVCGPYALAHFHRPYFHVQGFAPLRSLPAPTAERSPRPQLRPERAPLVPPSLDP